MDVLYENVSRVGGIAWFMAACLLLIPRPRWRDRGCYESSEDRPRLMVPLADRLLGQLGTMAAMIPPIMGATFVVLAFLHGQLNTGGASAGLIFDLWRIREAREYAFAIIYFAVSGLCLAGLAFVLRPTGRPEPRRHKIKALDKKPIRWPWRAPGGFRLWIVRTTALATGPAQRTSGK